MLLTIWFDLSIGKHELTQLLGKGNQKSSAYLAGIPEKKPHKITEKVIINDINY